MTIAIGYLRVSTERQARSGLGREAQVAAIEKHAAKNGLTVTDWFTDDGISGSEGIDKRPQLAAALAALKRGSVLLVAKRDRLARDSMLAAYLELAARRKGARIVSCAGEGTDDDTPANGLLRKIIDAFAEFEKMQIAARTKGGHAQIRKRGGWPGGKPPYGFRLEGTKGNWKLVEHPEEQRVMARARELHKDGIGCGPRMAEKLAAEGLRPRNGGAWHTTQLVRLCANGVVK